MKPRAISLFSGAGGLDLGFEKAGFDIVYANELNVASAATWKANRRRNEGAMHQGDIAAKMDEIELLQDIDVVFGGPPCQGFSIAGKMQEDDPRNQLVHIFMTVVERVRPRVVVMENVKALGVHPKWEKTRSSLLQKAEQLGYDADYAVFQVADYGVSENRERVLFVGVDSSKGSSSVFFDSIEQHKCSPPSLREVFGKVGAYGTDANPASSTAKVTVAKKPVLRGSAYSGMLVNGAGRPLNLEAVSPTLTASMGGNSTPIVDQRALDDPNETNWFVGLHSALSAGERGDRVVPDFIRRLTIKEAAAIQTFPAKYQFQGSRCSQYRQIGNAVPPRFSKAVACTVYEAYFR